MFETGPCEPWITAADLDCGEEADRASAALAASDVLFYLSGAVYTGSCTYTVHPGRDLCGCGWMVPHQYWWHAYYAGYGVWPDNSRQSLGAYPVQSVTNVTVDGDTLDPDLYRVEDHQWLVRTDCQPWPFTDTWTVTFTAGVDPPEMGVRAAKALACELVTTVSGGGGDCALPDNTLSFSRQGLQVQLLDPNDIATGLNLASLPHAVDVFLQAYNPHRLTGNAIVAIPGQPAPTTVTWP